MNVYDEEGYFICTCDNEAQAIKLIAYERKLGNKWFTRP